MSGLRGRCGPPRGGGREYGVRGLWGVETSVLGLSCPTASPPPHLRQTGQAQSSPSLRPCVAGSGRHCLGTAPATPGTAPVAGCTSRCLGRRWPGWPPLPPPGDARPLGRPAQCSAPGQCSWPTVRVGPEPPPFLCLQIPLERRTYLPQGFRHAYAGGMEGSALIVVEDTPRGGAILQHDLPGHGLGCLGLGALRGDSGVLFGQYCSFDGPQAPDGAPHLHLRMAVGFQDRLGHISQEVIGAIAVRDAWELRGDPPDEGVLFIRHPEAYRFAQPLCPCPRLGQELLNLGRGTG